MKTIEKSAIFNFEADKNRLLEQIQGNLYFADAGAAKDSNAPYGTISELYEHDTLLESVWERARTEVLLRMVAWPRVSEAMAHDAADLLCCYMAQLLNLPLKGFDADAALQRLREDAFLLEQQNP